MARCDHIKRQLADYSVGRGSRWQRALIGRHLAACPVCRAEQAALDRTAALLARVPLESAPAGTWESIRASIATAPRPVHVRTARPKWRLVMVAAALLAFAAGLLSLSPIHRPQPVVVPITHADPEMQASLERHLSATHFAPLADEAAVGLDLESTEGDS